MNKNYYASGTGHICSVKGPTPMAKGIELEDAQIIADLLNAGDIQKERITLLDSMLDAVLIEYDPLQVKGLSAEGKIYRIREILVDNLMTIRALKP